MPLVVNWPLQDVQSPLQQQPAAGPPRNTCTTHSAHHTIHTITLSTSPAGRRHSMLHTPSSIYRKLLAWCRINRMMICSDLLIHPSPPATSGHTKLPSHHGGQLTNLTNSFTPLGYISGQIHKHKTPPWFPAPHQRESNLDKTGLKQDNYLIYKVIIFTVYGILKLFSLSWLQYST